MGLADKFPLFWVLCWGDGSTDGCMFLPTHGTASSDPLRIPCATQASPHPPIKECTKGVGGGAERCLSSWMGVRSLVRHKESLFFVSFTQKQEPLFSDTQQRSRAQI